MSGLLYDINIKFDFNEYFNLSLKGDFNDFNQDPSRTPELTNTGSFEKGWNKENGKWYLYKQGTKEEIFSEIFTYKLGTKLNFKMARYEYEEPYIKSLNFTNDNLIFEPISGVVGSEEDYNKNFNTLLKMDETGSLAKEYLKIIYLDSIVFNVDRHTENFGFMRNEVTGKIVSLAPNFDNNLSLISRSYPNDLNRSKDMLISFFTDFLEENEVALKMFLDENIPLVFNEDLNNIINEMPKELTKDINVETVKEFILNGQDIINDRLLELSKEKRAI